MSEHGVILFFTTSSAMQAEKLLKGEDRKVKLVPTPRQFSSDCGISLRFNWGERDDISGSLEAAGVEYDSFQKLA